MTTAKQRYDAKRREQYEWRKFYKTPEWRGIRRDQLARVPYCQRCARLGYLTPATTVNHVEPHKGDWEKFLAAPFESVCKPCHDGDIQAEERNGFSRVVGPDGFPVDPRHPFNGGKSNGGQKREISPDQDTGGRLRGARKAHFGAG